jgi:hypothetical protein
VLGLKFFPDWWARAIISSAEPHNKPARVLRGRAKLLGASVKLAFDRQQLHRGIRPLLVTLDVYKKPPQTLPSVIPIRRESMPSQNKKNAKREKIREKDLSPAAMAKLVRSSAHGLSMAVGHSLVIRDGSMWAQLLAGLLQGH